MALYGTTSALRRRAWMHPRWLLLSSAAVAAAAATTTTAAEINTSPIQWRETNTAAAASAFNATQGTWFSYSASVGVYMGSFCGGGPLASASDAESCTPLTVYVNGQPADLAVQASCDDSGETISIFACTNTLDCSGSSCGSMSVPSGTCWNHMTLYNQPASLQLTCVTGKPSPLFLGVVIGGGLLLMGSVALCCCAGRIRKACERRGASTGNGGSYLQLGAAGSGARDAMRAILVAKYCASCGARVDGTFCPRCGAPAPADAAGSS